jgi:Cu/Ag efflux protein CusF
MSMYRTSLTSLAALALLVASSPAVIAQQAPSATVVAAKTVGKGGVVAVERLTAVVDSIDQSTRQVTLREADGTLSSYTVAPEVRNLPAVKVGDTVVLEHSAALVMELKKSGGAIRERVESESAARAASGAMPGAASAREIRVVADVIAIDPKAKTVRLRGPKRSFNLRVDDLQQLANVKVGDQVEATFIQAVALSVERAPR